MYINDVLINADAVDIVTRLRYQLAQNGIDLIRDVKDTPNNYMICCPYHKGGKERRPSAGIRKADGMFHCFACGEVHSLPEVVSHCFGYDDLGVYGWKWILQNFATVDVEVRKDVHLDCSRDIVRPVESSITEDELDRYRVYHPYMWKRKMTPEVVAIFDIGFDEDAMALTFPVRDVKGRTLFIARRSVNRKFFNYPAGAEKPVYGLYELSQLPNYPKEVIICESMIDAITCWVYGKYAVALNGLGNELQIRQLNAMPCRKFVLATDNDAAGVQARRVLRSKLRGKLISEYELPVGKKDINDLTQDEFNNLEEFF